MLNRLVNTSYLSKVLTMIKRHQFIRSLCIPITTPLSFLIIFFSVYTYASNHTTAFIGINGSPADGHNYIDFELDLLALSQRFTNSHFLSSTGPLAQHLNTTSKTLEEVRPSKAEFTKSVLSQSQMATANSIQRTFPIMTENTDLAVVGISGHGTSTGYMLLSQRWTHQHFQNLFKNSKAKRTVRLHMHCHAAESMGSLEATHSIEDILTLFPSNQCGLAFSREHELLPSFVYSDLTPTKGGMLNYISQSESFSLNEVRQKLDNFLGSTPTLTSDLFLEKTLQLICENSDHDFCPTEEEWIEVQTSDKLQKIKNEHGYWLSDMSEKALSQMHPKYFELIAKSRKDYELVLKCLNEFTNNCRNAKLTRIRSLESVLQSWELEKSIWLDSLGSFKFLEREFAKSPPAYVTMTGEKILTLSEMESWLYRSRSGRAGGYRILLERAPDRMASLLTVLKTPRWRSLYERLVHIQNCESQPL